MDWWKSKHNTHHAAPNELADDGARVVDPDIDTLPLLVNALLCPGPACCTRVRMRDCSSFRSSILQEGEQVFSR